MKRSIAILLTILLCLSALGGCNIANKSSSSNVSSSKISNEESKEEKTEDIAKLVVAYRTPAIPNDIKDVEKAMNEILREKINAEIELMPISTGTYTQQMMLMLAGGEPLDVCSTYSTVYTSAYAKGQLIPLDDLIAEYGKGITENVDEMFLKCGKIDGKTYAVVCNHDQARGYGTYLLRKDILEKHDIDISNVDTYEELTEVFQKVKENEPDMTIVYPYSPKSTFLVYHTVYDNLGSNFGVLMDYGQNTEVINMFETDWYKSYLNLIRGWYESGFISKDVTTEPESGSTLVKADLLFSYPNTKKPGLLRQENNSCGKEMVTVSCEKVQATSAAPMAGMWSIPLNCKKPEKAMEFINELFENQEVIELLCNGIEGKHYKRLEDNTIDFPDSIDATSSGYINPMSWMMGNQFLTSVWVGDDPNLWEEMEKFNKSGTFSKATGFTFDNASVATELTALQNVYDEYRFSLENGVVDPEIVLPQMIEKLNTAGMQKVIDAKQTQLDKWLETNK